MGAALNTLLEHVEASLDARHRSEQQVRQFVADASHELRTPLDHHRRLHRAGPPPPRRRQPPHRARQGRGGVRADDLAGRGHAAAGPARRRPPARPRAGRPDPAARRGGRRRPGGRSRTTGGGSTCRRPRRRGHRRRAAAAPGGHQPAHQRPQAHPGRDHGHRDRPGGRVRRARRRTGLPARLRGPRLRAVRPGRPGPRAQRRQSGGAGLGLSLVEAIVRSHGGTVTLDSAPGGTTIAVRLR